MAVFGEIGKPEVRPGGQPHTIQNLFTRLDLLDEVGFCGGRRSGMTQGMVAEVISESHHRTYGVGMHADVRADDEEGAVAIVCAEQLGDADCRHSVPVVVKGECHDLAGRRDTFQFGVGEIDRLELSQLALAQPRFLLPPVSYTHLRAHETDSYL